MLFEVSKKIHLQMMQIKSQEENVGKQERLLNNVLFERVFFESTNVDLSSELL